MFIGHIGVHLKLVCYSVVAMASKKKLLPGYFTSMQDSDGKSRWYIDKLSILESLDPYESERFQWLDMMWTYGPP